MKTPRKWAALAVVATALSTVAPARALAQDGSIEFVIRVTPTGGVEEPVRGFPVYLLSRSYEDIQHEADAIYPKQSEDDFINGLDVSPELKAWMTKNHWISFSGQDFIKKLTADDIMTVPEFYKAYMDRNSGDQSTGFPTPKYKESEKQKDPDKYAKDEQRYKDAIRHYIEQIPESINGIDLNLQEIDPNRKWHEMEAKRNPSVERKVMELAQGKYLIARTETNLQGQGFFPNIPAGTYFLSTLNVPAAVGDARPMWDVPLTVRPGDVAYSVLSNVNAIEDPSHSSP